MDDQSKADRASLGGKARMGKLSREERSAIASAAAKARWQNIKKKEVAKEASIQVSRGSDLPEVPEAQYKGVLNLAGTDIPVYNLSDGKRVIARVAATEYLSGIKRGGALESYLGVASLQPFISVDYVLARLVTFKLKDVEMLPQEVKGMPSDVFIEICQAYVRLLEASRTENSGVTLTTKQEEIAIRAGMFLAACAKVGLDALIDEATGYQNVRQEDALQIKLRLYLEEEMRKWEKTFPDQLWEQFGRLTNWKGKIYQRPKYWGKLVMKLIYEHLDPDVAQWLRENAPEPMKGQNYHQWLSSQYGLRKLIEHIWKVIGIASTLDAGDIDGLTKKMEELYGRKPGFQYELRLVATQRIKT
jgi:hypothetical protein